MSRPRHFLDLAENEPAVLRRMIDRSLAIKSDPGALNGAAPLAGRTLAMIFEKPSTRTRVSFEVAMRSLGGNVMVLNPNDMQIGRGETIEDTARVLSRYVDAIMIRTFEADTLAAFAKHATVPVINGLTSRSHPCQLMADVMTFEEHRGPIEDRVVAWSGDGNNVACSWIEAAAAFKFELRLACPPVLAPPAAIVELAERNGGRIALTDDPCKAVRGADCVVTDTWVSMGDDAEDHRHNILAPYQVDERLMALAKPEAIFMHCLPAHRGEEVTAEVIDGPQSVVWDEAENRMHAQKAILLWCLE